VKLPEISRAGLADLLQKKVQAERDYATALNSTVAALGLDPRLPHSVNLDTGELTPATVKEGE
jgi:hypothetical protein